MFPRRGGIQGNEGLATMATTRWTEVAEEENGGT